MVRNSFWSIMTVFCVSPVLESSGIWKVVTRACSESVHIGNGNPLPRVVRYTKCDGVCFWGIFYGVFLGVVFGLQFTLWWTPFFWTPKNRPEHPLEGTSNPDEHFWVELTSYILPP